MLNMLSRSIRQKLNPVQEDIKEQEGGIRQSTAPVHAYSYWYKKYPEIKRPINFLVDALIQVDIDVKERMMSGRLKIGKKSGSLDQLLNVKPNPFIDIMDFRTQIYLDLLVEGNAYLYWDGTWLYNLPAEYIAIKIDDRNFIDKYVYMSGHTGILPNTYIPKKDDRAFDPSEIVHVKLANPESLFIGLSALSATHWHVESLIKMKKYEDNFFDTGGLPTFIVETESVLSPKIKSRLESSWMGKFNNSGKKRPLILDGGMRVANSEVDFKGLEFKETLASKKYSIAEALGVPSVLLYGGNNANISPNMNNFMYNTVAPLAKRLLSQLEVSFGKDLELNFHKLMAVRPDIKATADYHSQLVNNGIMTANEAREGLRLPSLTTGGCDDIRIPQNIAGSAAGQLGGGRPRSEEE